MFTRVAIVQPTMNRPAPASTPATASDGAVSEPDAAYALDRVAGDGIHRLSVSTPWAIGTVNSYLLEGDPLTLIDSGPNSARSLRELERALAGHGYRVEDLELLVVSHQHVDHVGLVEVLAERSGAEVAALDLLAPYLESFDSSFEADDEFSARLMQRHGVPDDMVVVLRAAARTLREWGSSVHVGRPLDDGDRLPMGGTNWEVLTRPGHSPTDTVFHDTGRGLLIGADHLLRSISSNPIVCRPVGLPPEQATDRPNALAAYMRSLEATQAMDLEIVLTGHGDPVTDHRRLISERMAMHRRRAERFLEHLDEGPLTAFELAGRVWGRVALEQPLLTLSEVLGHMDLLVAEGRVVEEANGETAVFSTA